MKVILSGLNLDIETIKDLKSFIQQVADLLDEGSVSSIDPEIKKANIQYLVQEATVLLERDNLTPETLSAAYARISRNPRPVYELREIARQEVDKARRSNQNIIFGLGHSSVAEHASFNFDILGVSRYAVEIIEHFRLASYTEKSQRYILFKDDFVIPPEIQGSGLEENFKQIIKEQNETYYSLYEKLRPYFFEKHKELAENPKNHNLLEGLAKEDARYIIALATQTQLGMTVNARSLENIIAKCNCHSLSEIREYGNKLYESTKLYTPSIVKHVDPTDYLLSKQPDLSGYISNQISEITTDKKDVLEEVRLVDFTMDADDLVLATILFKELPQGLDEAKKIIKQLKPEQKAGFFKEIFRHMNPWDSVLREFEYIYFTFELIVSASNYGQLKRHRMATIISQDYDLSLGVTIPSSVLETKQEAPFLQMIEKTQSFYQELRLQYTQLSPYILTNAHRRRVLFKMNLRELYHFSRLRVDQHAQWDIRQNASRMISLVKSQLPLSGALLAGKDEFYSVYQEFMQK